MARTKCAWCGAAIMPKLGRARCEYCTWLLNDYKRFCRTIFKTSDKQYLIKFRNLCIDLKYNMPGAELLPKDLDYQFDRVNRYIDGDSD